ncbi:MAG: peptide deformylase [Rickettsiella sp.]|nr:peptide deformylase [Rickettsiella sp.]
MKRIITLFLTLILFYGFSSNASTTIINNKKHNRETMMKNSLHLVDISMPDHAVLRKSAEPVLFPLDNKTKEFIETFKTFFAGLKSPYGKPAGLAAPQVGYSLRIIIIQIPPEAKEKRKDVYDTLPPTVLINPTYVPIINAGESKDWEGCFSVPDKMGEVYRYKQIRYEAFKVDGKKITGVAKGFLARLLQHEIGHLNGELYIDCLRPDCRYESIAKAAEIIKQETKN